MPGRARLLAELRRVEWRRLLLAVALLSAWGRALLPLPAEGAVAVAGAVMCGGAGLASDVDDGAGDGARETRTCPLCRLAEVPDGLLPPAPVATEVFLDRASRLACRIEAPSRVTEVDHPPARGPPAIATTL